MNRIIVVLLLIPAIVFAQRLQGIEGTTEEVRVGDGALPVGARSAGMGGAHIAAADDYTAAHYNPANLAFFKRIELSGCLSNTGIRNSSELNGVAGTRNLTKTRIDYIGGALALPVIRGGASIAVGYNRLNSFDRVLYAQDSTRKALELSSGGLYAFDIAGGVQVAPGLAFGATVEVYSGDEIYGWDLEKYFTGGDLQRLLISDNIKYQYSGVGLKLGLTYMPVSIIRIGGVIHFPGTLSIDESGTQRTDSLFTSRESFKETSNIVETYKISMPYSFGFGGSLNFLYLTIAGDIDYTDWRQLEYKSPSWILDQNKYFANSYRSVWQIRLGAEAIIPVVGIKIRAGYAREPLPYIGTQVNKDRYSLTFGTGMLIAKLFSVDIALAFSKYARNDTEARLIENYKFTRFYLGMAYRF